MRVLGISLFATIACTLFSGATPINPKARDVSPRAAPATLSEILTTTTKDLTVVRTNVEGIVFTTVDATVPIVQDNLANVKSILNDAIGAVSVLAESPVGDVLGEVAKLVAGVVMLVAQILFAVTNLVGKGVVSPVLPEVGSLLANFLVLVFKLLPAVLGLVLPLLGNVTQILSDLGLSQVLSVLGITV